MFPARTPEPPYYAVIFASRRTDGHADEYAATAAHMEELAADQPGFLGIESVRGADGNGITVSYWDSEQAIAAWRAHPEHLEAQRAGRQRFYEHYRIRVSRVERD